MSGELIKRENVNQYSTKDKEYLLKNLPLNSFGLPEYWPSTNEFGKTISFSFVNCIICDRQGNQLSKEVATFDVLDGEMFDRNSEDALTKINFISALLSENRYVKGGVYCHGEFFTGKINSKNADSLTKNFMNAYFHIEDGDLLLEYFDKIHGANIPLYWPTKSYDKDKNAIFSAVKASITSKGSNKSLDEDINFNIFKGDVFDLNNKKDMQKAEVIRSLLSENRIVRGFYYKGKLLPDSLSKNFKLYLEKSFVKKNFTVNQRDYLFTFISKDKKTGNPLYWPMRDKDGREIACSVVNCCASWVDCSKYANFDVYTDEVFDLKNEDFKAKLNIIQELLSNKNEITGALYFDGVLIPGIESVSEIERRKSKVEKALKIYIDNKEDFVKISTNFTVEDRDNLLRLCGHNCRYFPNSKEEVPQRDDSFKENPYLIKLYRCNIIDDKGNFLLEKDVSETISLDNSKYSKEALMIFNHLANPHAKVFGGVYYKGKNAANKISVRKNLVSTVFKSLLTCEDYSLLVEVGNKKIFNLSLDKKSKMPLYWATTDRNGRETLLSVVDADVHFKVGRNIVKAANNMNFDIYVGETFGLVGESGSGKTTISRAILGINKLSKGGIYFKGKLISGKMSKHEAKANKKNIQMIFQDPAASLNERANIDYIISEGLYNFKLFKTNEERLEKVTNMLRQVGLLPEHLSRYPHEFSGGQRQRIGIARALVIEPQLVLADEPISALDVSIRAQVLNLLRKLQKEEDLTYLFIAHDLSIIRYISDRIAVMHKGYIVELGPAEEIYSHPLHPYTRSLLTAIPQPDPKTKDQRVKIPYTKQGIDYETCVWKEFRPGHYVLVNETLDSKITERVNKINALENEPKEEKEVEIKEEAPKKKTRAKKSTSKE